MDKPDKELTNDELDAEIAKAGMDYLLDFMPAGNLRDSFRDMLRYNFKMAHYEKTGTITDGVVLVEIDGQHGFIRRAVDTDWNFHKFLRFADQVFAALTNAI